MTCCCGFKWFFLKKKKIFEIVMEHLKLISMYIKSFADSSKKLTAVVIYIYNIYSCGFACQQRVLKTFPGPGYLHSEDGVV